MSSSQTLVEFNFILNIECGEFDELDASKIKDVAFDSDSTVKTNLRNRITKVVLESFESMGGVHLEEESFNPSNKKLIERYRSIHFGGSPGKKTGIGDYLIRFRFSVISFVDCKAGMKPDSVEIWKKMAGVLDGKSIYVDELGGVTGTIRVDKPSEQSWWDARDINMGEDVGHNQTSEIDKSKDASFDKTMNEDSVGGPFSLNDSDGAEVDKDNPLNDYDAMDAISDIQDTYEKYENDAVQVRKPTESEIKEISSVVYEQVKKIIESDEPLYLDEIPENWKNATCSNCSKGTDSVFLKFQKENMNIIQKRLEKDFGYGSEDEFTDSRITNFYVTENGQLLIRPEEIVSWLISIANETRPYCEPCNSEVGGTNHSGFIETKVKSTNSSRGSLDNNSTENYVNQKSPTLDYESLEIDTAEDIKEGFSGYRSPTRSEAEEIRKSISQYLWTLGTRSGDKNPQFNSVYRTLFNRDYDQESGRLGYYECDVCGSPVDEDVDESETLRKFDKHHIEPAATNRTAICVQKIQDLIEKSKNADSQSSPIKVSKESSRFLFTDEFLSLVETLSRNVDTLGLFCDECEEEIEEVHSVTIESTEEETQDAKESEKELLECSFGFKSSRFVDFVCPICRRRKSEDSIYRAKVVSGKCVLSKDGRNDLVPVVENTIISQDFAAGLCIEHKNEIRRRIENFDTSGSTRKEKLRNLLVQLNHN